MKKSASVSLSLVVLVLGGIAAPAYADSAEAMCEVRMHGEEKRGQSGPCTFSQRQGFIDLDLRNGDTYSLSPGNRPNHYKDQMGNKVVRTHAGGNEQEFKWEGGKKVVVTFVQSSSQGAGGASSGGYGASAEPTTTTQNVRLAAGQSGAEIRGTLSPGSTIRYVLKAKNGQFLYVRVAAEGPDIDYQIFNPDNTFLLESMTAATEYRGQLWQTGDHVVNVINRGTRTTSFNVIIGL